jgi:pimeloyl-CoA synthetase
MQLGLNSKKKSMRMDAMLERGVELEEYEVEDKKMKEKLVEKFEDLPAFRGGNRDL